MSEVAYKDTGEILEEICHLVFEGFREEILGDTSGWVFKSANEENSEKKITGAYREDPERPLQ